MQDIYKSIEEYSPSRECNVLIVFDDMIADMISNKNLSTMVTELFIKEKLKISFNSITQPYLQVPKYGRLNCTHFFIMKIPNKHELQQIAINHS